jgi:7-carboxy-7-deazaguanine synthase
MKVCETFSSIQGESSLAGLATFFIRTSGCNLNCEYCDSKFAHSEGREMSCAELIKEAQDSGLDYICITGGEPLLQDESRDLANRLVEINKIVSIETNGSLFAEGLDSRVKRIFDVKTPDSGAANTFDLRNIKVHTNNDEFKFVICSENDFTWAEEFVAEHLKSSDASILYSPSFDKISEKWLAKNLVLKKSSARLQIQLHKKIWFPDTRGV